MIRLERQDDGSFLAVEYADTVWYTIMARQTEQDEPYSLAVGHVLGVIVEPTTRTVGLEIVVKPGVQWSLRWLAQQYILSGKFSDIQIWRSNSSGSPISPVETYLKDGSVRIES